MPVTDIGYALAGLTAVGIIFFIGARFLLAPSTAAAGFGIAAWHDGGKAHPYLSVKGVRDIASGLIADILLAARMPHVHGLVRAGRDAAGGRFSGREQGTPCRFEPRPAPAATAPLCGSSIRTAGCLLP